MEVVPLGRTGLVVSRLGMGCVKLGSVGGGHSRRSSERLVRAAVDAGIRLFDTADAYGSGLSESVLGAALAGVPDDVVVATKVGYRFHERGPLAQLAHGAAGAAMRRLPGRSAGQVGASGAYVEQDFSPAYVRRAVAGSLRRLGRTHIDLLQFHGPPPATSCDLPVVVAELIDGGLIRSFGVGCERLDVAASWVGVSGLACVQLAFGVLDPQAATDVLPAARAAGVGVIARGVLGGGLLAQFARSRPTDLDPLRSAQVARLEALARANDVDLMQLALWYGLHRAAVDAVLVGISSLEQLDANTALVNAPPPSDALLQDIVQIVEPVRPSGA